MSVILISELMTDNDVRGAGYQTQRESRSDGVLITEVGASPPTILTKVHSLMLFVGGL